MNIKNATKLYQEVIYLFLSVDENRKIITRIDENEEEINIEEK